MHAYAHLLVADTPEGVRTLTLDRADRLNAVNGALAASFAEAVRDAGREDAVRVLVVTGAGRAFCSGLDLSTPPELPTATRAERLDPYAWVGSWVNSVVACEKPVIAAVNGPAAGAGFGLALACDLRIVSASAKLTAGYVRRGLSPDAGVSHFLPRHIGLGRSAEILLTGREVDAEEAERIGLVTTIFPDSAFAAGVAEFAARLASGPSIAHALTKRLLVSSFETPLDVALRDVLVHIKTCFRTADVSEAMTAFREKRLPVFRGH